MKTAHQPVLDYIDGYWEKCIFYPHKRTIGSTHNLLMHIGRINLPYPSVAPNHNYFAGSHYYWDSYFSVVGLTAADKLDLAKQVVDNTCYLFDKFGHVPARNTHLSIGRSQPPLLTRMAFAVYDKTHDKAWLDVVMARALKEYEQFWTSGRRLHESSGLSQYKPKYMPKGLATYESGWDVSSRFAGHNQILPVDLNCLLYRYESDFFKWAQLSSKNKTAKYWEKQMKTRKEAIDTWFWNDKESFYFDNDLEQNKLSGFKTLAGFYPLYCGVASQAQAKQCVSQLKVFEQSHGLTSSEFQPWTGRQWDYPNGWAPLHFFVLEGLKRYGFSEDYERISKKWLAINARLFEKTGQLWEKYDVVDGKIGLNGRYPTQPGFTWTNAVFLHLLHDKQ